MGIIDPCKKILSLILNNLVFSIGTNGRCCSRWPLGGRLARMLVATISTIFFLFSFHFCFVSGFVSCFVSSFLHHTLFSQKECSNKKKPIQQKLFRAPNNLKVHPFPDPGSNFGFCSQCSIAGDERLPPCRKAGVISNQLLYHLTLRAIRVSVEVLQKSECSHIFP